MSQKHRPSKKQAGENRIKAEPRITWGIFEQLFEALPDAVLVTDHTGRIQFANHLAEEMFGYGPDELVGQPIEILIPARFDKHNKLREAYQAQPHMRSIENNLELFALRKEGLEFPVEIGLSPLETEEGQVVIAFIRDVTPRKLVNQDLKRSEARNRALLAAIPDLMIRVHRDGTIWDYHLEDPQDLLVDPEAFLGRKLSEIFPPDVSTGYLNAIAGVVETGKRQSIEYSLSHANQLRYFESWITPSNPDEFVFIIRDITEQRQGERALRESEQRFRHLFSTSPDAVVLIDPHDPGVSWPIVDCNDAACRMNGYAREEMLGQSIDLLNIAAGTHAERATYLDRLRHENVVHMESFHRHKDGRIFPVEISTSLFTFGERELVLGIDRDITERVRAKEALEQSEKRFRALIENSADAITLLDANGVTIYDSPAAPGMLGYGPDEMIGQSLFSLVHPDDLTFILPRFQELLQTPGARENATFRIRHKNGSWRWIESVVTNLLAEPAVKAIVTNYRDVTERVQAEIALRESDERFRGLFENSPVSIWEEDFSQVKAHLEGLKGLVGGDFEAYLSAHPEVVAECSALVKILDVNQASLALYGVSDKLTLLENLSNVFTPDTFDTFRQELLTLWKGERRLEIDGVARTLAGQRRDVTILWAVVPGYEANYSRVLVSLIDITERRQAAEEIRSRTGELATLYELSRALALANHLDEVFDLVNRRTVENVHSTFARIALLDGDELVTRSAYPTRVLEHNLLVGSRHALADLPYSRRVLEQDEPVILRADNPGLSPEERARLLLDFTQSLCLVPLRVRDFASDSSRPLGLLMVGEARNENREPFTPEKLRLARGIGDQAAIAIENTRLFNDLQRSNSDLVRAYDATIAGWSAALDLRDRETEGHTQRVTEMSAGLAERMGFSPQELLQVRRGALLHDIGKMGVPDRILHKPDKLTDEEWAIMHLHPVYAYEFLKPIPYLEPALDIPYCHHEKWDGSGYPRGLQGEDIPLAARIFAIVDVYDALTSDRPYRAAWTHEQTMEYILSLRGAHFDPGVVDVFREFMREG